MKLTDKACQNAKPREKPYKLSDGGGLYLLVNSSGRYWRLKYRILSKEKVLALGTYPQISLLEAREAAKAAKKTLIAGVDPMEAKRATKRKAALHASNTFEAVAREWHDKESSSGWSKDHADNVMHRMKIDIFPYIGKRPIAEIDTPELLYALKKIEDRGALDISRRARSICDRIFQYGIAIPAERMKMKQAHIVPLSRQALSILKDQYLETGHLNTPYAFPSQIRPKDTMSNGTVLGAIKRLGYKNLQTGHGFRAFARTAIREHLDYDPDVIEAQLAHKPAGPLGSAYDRAKHLGKRKIMMQEWADYLDALTQNNKVIVAKFGRAA